jgi:hypothetical protein
MTLSTVDSGTRTALRGRTLLGLTCAAAVLVGPSTARAQEAVVPDAAPDSAAVMQRISPGGAFLRSMAFPGWGQAATGSYSRATFYFLSQAATGMMLFKTQRFLTAARERRAFWEGVVERELLEQGVAPDSIAVALEEDPRVETQRELEEARSQQREDWLAFGIFMLLLGGADAFVSAHLADFPEPIRVETAVLSPGPTPRVEVKASIPWAGPGSRKRAGRR